MQDPQAAARDPHGRERGWILAEGQQGLGEGKISPLHTAYKNLGEHRKLPQWGSPGTN